MNLKKLLTLDIQKGIQYINTQPQLKDKAMEILVKTKYFSKALHQYKSQVGLELSYVYSKRSQVETVLKYLEPFEYDRNWLEFRYWVHRNRLDKLPKVDQPEQHQLIMTSLLDMKLFQNALDYYTVHKQFITCFGHWISVLLKNGIPTNTVIWELQDELGWSDLCEIYSSFLSIHDIYIQREVKEHSLEQVLLYGNPNEPFTFHLYIQNRKTMEIESKPLPLELLISFYSFAKQFSSEKVIREAMLSVHLLHYYHPSHQQMLENLYFYFDDSGLDSLLELLFKKTNQVEKLEAFRAYR